MPSLRNAAANGTVRTALMLVAILGSLVGLKLLHPGVQLKPHRSPLAEAAADFVPAPTTNASDWVNVVVAHTGAYQGRKNPDYLHHMIAMLLDYNPRLMRLYLVLDPAGEVEWKSFGGPARPMRRLDPPPPPHEASVFTLLNTNQLAPVYRARGLSGHDGMYTAERGLARIFYCESVMRYAGLDHVIQFETDQAVYMDLVKHLPTFRRVWGGAVAFPLDNPDRAMPSVTWLGSLDALTQFNTYLQVCSGADDSRNADQQDRYPLTTPCRAADLSHENLMDSISDMRLPARYIQDNLARGRTDLVGTLPLVPPFMPTDWRNDIGDLVPPAHRSRYWHAWDAFEPRHVFDGAAVGQYLIGIRPLNEGDMRGFTNEASVFKWDCASFEFVDDPVSGLPYPVAFVAGVPMRVANLHVQCKCVGDVRLHPPKDVIRPFAWAKNWKDQRQSLPPARPRKTPTGGLRPPRQRHIAAEVSPHRLRS